MMKSNDLLGPTAGVLAVLALGACGTMSDPRALGGPAAASPAVASGSSYPATTYPVTTQAPEPYLNQNYTAYGVVHSIERVRQEPTAPGGSGIGIGAVAGAVVGGLLGNQVGGGSGKTAATVIGAAGGAYVGHEIENRQPQVQAQPDVNKITVRMSDGSYQAVLQPLDADFRVGDRVRVGESGLQRY